jgi:hypothetical protein
MEWSIWVMKKLAFLLVLVLVFGVEWTTRAGGMPLPDPPTQKAINRIINQTSGIPFEPIKVPRYVKDRCRNDDEVQTGDSILYH